MTVQYISFDEIDYTQYEQERIGAGAFGVVHKLKGSYPPACIKYISDHRTSEQEYNILRKFVHSNVIQLLGLKKEDLAIVGIIMDFCEKGSLETLIFDSKYSYSMRTVYEWASQLFSALSYLFVTHQIIHRDLKSSNIFVTAMYHLKIGDFGVSKQAFEESHQTFCGTHRYRCPSQDGVWSLLFSTFTTQREMSHRRDVYSLGLVLWEILERRLVFSQYSNPFNANLFNDHVRTKTVKLETPDGPSHIRNIVGLCTNFNRYKRPMATEVCRFLSRKTTTFAEMDFIPTMNEQQTVLIKPSGSPVSVDESSSGPSNLLPDAWSFPVGVSGYREGEAVELLPPSSPGSAPSRNTKKYLGLVFVIGVLLFAAILVYVFFVFARGGDTSTTAHVPTSTVKWTTLSTTTTTHKPISGTSINPPTTNSIDAPKCEDGWVHFDRYCYRHFSDDSDKLYVDKAAEVCRYHNSFLVSIHSAEEQKFVNDLKKGWWTWLGLEHTNNRWSWSDGSKVDYENWEPGQPNLIYRYTNMRDDNGKWMTQFWYDKNLFICKRRDDF